MSVSPPQEVAADCSLVGTLAAVLPTEAKRRRVLVVDDDELVRTAVCRSLTRLGFEVSEAADAGSGLDMLSEAAELRPIDLMLTDIFMPGLSGPALAALAQDRWSTLKVLLMSGAPSAGEAGRLPLLRKPFLRAELAQVVEQLLRSPTQISPAAYERREAGQELDPRPHNSACR
jgi:CheY-like chemotaxis protein